MAISSRSTLQKSLSSAALTALALGLTSCATVTPQSPAIAAAEVAKAAAPAANAARSNGPPATAAAGANVPGAPGAAPAAAPPPPAPRPFAEIIKDAKEEPGFFTTWKKDDKVWIEIPEAMWDRPFF